MEKDIRFIDSIRALSDLNIMGDERIMVGEWEAKRANENMFMVTFKHIRKDKKPYYHFFHVIPKDNIVQLIRSKDIEIYGKLLNKKNTSQ